jgi:hypothetical protein
MKGSPAMTINLRRETHQVTMEKSVTNSDTAGEVSFSGTGTSTSTIFRLAPSVSRVYFRLRQQYRRW